MNNSYRFGVLTYKVIGIVCNIVFAGAAIAALLSHQYLIVAGFLIFVAMGTSLIASAGSYEISSKSIIHHSLLGTFQIEWANVERIEIGTGGSIVLHGRDKRFILAPPAYWSGEQKPEAFQLLHTTMRSIDKITFPSNTADYKTNKNVRIR